MKKAVRIIVSGIVQGVCYRYFCSTNAAALHLCGYAKNLMNGSVEVVAKGDKDKLDEFIMLLERGPIASRVDNLEIVELDPEGCEYDSFGISF